MTDADRAIVRRIFETCGTEDEVPREADIDYLTGHSGTGPAYPALLAAAMMQDAIAHGIPRDVARRAVVGLLIGTGRIFEKTGEDPTDTVAAFVELPRRHRRGDRGDAGRRLPGARQHRPVRRPDQSREPQRRADLRRYSMERDDALGVNSAGNLR